MQDWVSRQSLLEAFDAEACVSSTALCLMVARHSLVVDARNLANRDFAAAWMLSQRVLPEVAELQTSFQRDWLHKALALFGFFH